MEEAVSQILLAYRCQIGWFMNRYGLGNLKASVRSLR